jgi:hypothetical protein
MKFYSPMKLFGVFFAYVPTFLVDASSFSVLNGMHTNYITTTSQVWMDLIVLIEILR